LISCGAKLDMFILLSPGQKYPLPQSCADTLSKRAAERHRKGERPEDDRANFQMRLEMYEANAEGLLTELLGMDIGRCIIDPMHTPRYVEDMAVHEWSTQMKGTGTCARGRSLGSSGDSGARERRDPSEADMEISLCLPSGHELLRKRVPARSTVAALKNELENVGETEFDHDLCYVGLLLCNTDVISDVNGFQSGSVLTVVRKEKPPPVRRSSSPSRAGNTHCTSGRCFTPASVVRVLEGGVEVQRFFKQVKVGDMVRTGPGEGLGFFRRVQRVWKHLPHALDEPLPAYELAEGCRITIGHPALVNGVWRRPEDICNITSFENVVYQLEIEGHTDTVLVGSSSGVVCALLGCYCGEDFGWNIFTRKTVRCDKQQCKRCAKACIPGLTFDHTKITQRILDSRYEPY